MKNLLSHLEEKNRPLGFIEGRDDRITMAPAITVQLPCRSKILFWSVEAGESVKGFNVTYAYVDELPDMDEDSYNVVFDRTGRESVPHLAQVLARRERSFRARRAP